jgi:hypothetical protein
LRLRAPAQLRDEAQMEALIPPTRSRSQAAGASTSRRPAGVGGVGDSPDRVPPSDAHVETVRPDRNEWRVDCPYLQPPRELDAVINEVERDPVR